MTARRTVGIDEIEVGRRARVDVGDLTDLIQSIADVGLLQPVVITDDNRLIAGGRRIEACRKLAMTEVPVIVAAHLNDAASLLSAERDENTCRKDMTPSELVAIGRSLEDLERPKAEARRRDGQSRGGAIHAAQVLGLPQKTEHLSEDLAAEFHAGKTDVVVGKALGVGASTYYRAKTLVKAAETGDERAAAAVADMDRTGKVTPAYNAYRGRTTTPSGTAAPREQAPPLKNANGRRYPQRPQRKALTEGVAALSGLCTGLATVTDLDDSIDAEEAARWARDLNQALRVLRSLHTKLKEKSHGSH